MWYKVRLDQFKSFPIFLRSALIVEILALVSCAVLVVMLISQLPETEQSAINRGAELFTFLSITIFSLIEIHVIRRLWRSEGPRSRGIQAWMIIRSGVSLFLAWPVYRSIGYSVIACLFMIQGVAFIVYSARKGIASQRS